MPPPRSKTPPECPVCGADVPPKAKACPECGADENTGWNEEMTRYDGIDLPDSAFEEEGMIPKRSERGQTRRVLFTIAGIVLLLALLLRVL